jgi:hypothetical protein
MNTNDIAIEVENLLRHWPGYSIFKKTMDEYADVQVGIAGGFLRNIVMRKASSKDVDVYLAGPSVIPFINRLAERGHVTFNAFGYPKWRPEAECQRHFDLVPICAIRSGPRRLSGLNGVLNQMDFTCNGIGMDLRSGVIHDPQAGIAACRRRQLKMIRWDHGDYRPIAPDHPLTEGAARWFRALHYAARLDLEIESRTKRWLIDHQQYRSMKQIFSQTRFVPDLSRLEELGIGPADANEPATAAA